MFRTYMRVLVLMLQIHDNPELGWHEKHAHHDLTEFLEKQGFNVTRGAYNLPTAFIAEYSHGKGRSVSFNAEYGAVPGMGHACGHNLIATAFGCRRTRRQRRPQEWSPQGQSNVSIEALRHACFASLLKLVSIVGTPAEEIGGGKAKLIQAGAYDDLDCSLMTHPGPRNYMFYAEYPALMTARVNWTGG
jgi:metal-dependent amidase/aminoacylase/carboxypeptidase family protein